jgi:hypothetical protein
VNAVAVDQELKLRPEFRREQVKKCAKCGKGLAHSGLPLFWRVTIERFGFDADVCRRADAMERYFNNLELAAVFSTGEPLAKRFSLSQELLICEPCAMEFTCVAALAELDRDEDECAS